jgi:hypothetical protein
MFSQDLSFGEGEGERDLPVPSTSKPRPPLTVQEIESIKEALEEEEEEEEDTASAIVEDLKRKLHEKDEELAFLRGDNNALRQGLKSSQEYIHGFGRKYGHLLRQTMVAKDLMSEVSSYLCKASQGEKQDIDEVTRQMMQKQKYDENEDENRSNFLLAEQRLFEEGMDDQESSSGHLAELYKYPGEELSQAFVNEVAKVATHMKDMVARLDGTANSPPM